MMEPVNYKTITSFLEQFPEENGRNVYEENLNPGEREISNWTLLGTLNDGLIDCGSAMYKPWQSYALGFYPYNGCDIYKDDQGRIVLSYVELGGHFPFRRSFIATKASPFITEPVCFGITIQKTDHAPFLAFLDSLGLTPEKAEQDLEVFKEAYQITHELNPEEIYLYRRYFNERTDEFYYTIIAKRQTAHVIASKFRADASTRNSEISE